MDKGSVRRWVVRPLAAACLLLIGATAAFGLFGYVTHEDPWTAVQRFFPERCTVGLAGAAVSVTYDGPGAGRVCDSWRGQTSDGGSWYRYAGGEEPAGSVICQLHRSGELVTVRDSGALTLYGSSVCQSMLGQ